MAAGAGLLDNVVITGGSGAVGLHYARYLAERGARRIVLLSRGGVDPATAAELAGAHGAEVLAPHCDVTIGRAGARRGAEHGGDGASLVIHAAGAATFAARDELTPARSRTPSPPRSAGLARLTELWPLRPDARILVCSSVSGVWGGRGHAAYSAANRMLDVMAGQLRADGRHCVAVRWGLWEGTRHRRRRRGGPDRTLRTAADGARGRDRGQPARPPERPVDLRRRPRPAAARSSTAATPHGTESGTDDIGRSTSAALVRAELAAALNLGDAAAIDLDTSLLDLGVDSLLALDLRKRLRRATGKIGAAGRPARRHHRRRADRQPRRPQNRSEKVETSRD